MPPVPPAPIVVVVAAPADPVVPPVPVAAPFGSRFRPGASIRKRMGPLGSSGAPLGRCCWKIPTWLAIELGRLAQRGHVPREQELTQRVAIELLSLDPIEARGLDHPEPPAERASHDGPGLRDAEALLNP